MFKKGVDSELIRAISAHKLISSFARYNKIDDDQKATAMTVALKMWDKIQANIKEVVWNPACEKRNPQNYGEFRGFR